MARCKRFRRLVALGLVGCGFPNVTQASLYRHSPLRPRARTRPRLRRPAPLRPARKSGRNSNRAVVGIVPVRVCRSGRRQLDSSIFRERDHTLRAAFGNIEADEVAASRSRPTHAWNARQLFTKNFEHLLEFRRNQRPVLIHQLQNSRLIFQKPHVAQLVDFVRPNRPCRQPRQEPLYIFFGRGEHGQSRTRQGNF